MESGDILFTHVASFSLIQTEAIAEDELSFILFYSVLQNKSAFEASLFLLPCQFNWPTQVLRNVSEISF